MKEVDLPVVLMDARHANAALSTRPTKSDRSDARGLAEMLRMGWYRAVTAKSFTAHERLALLAARRRLVAIRTDLDAQIRQIAQSRLLAKALAVGKGGQAADDLLGRNIVHDAGASGQHRAVAHLDVIANSALAA